MVCIRENTEDVYSGMESWPDEDTVHCVKVITRGASERVAKFAIEFAEKQNRRRVRWHLCRSASVPPLCACVRVDARARVCVRVPSCICHPESLDRWLDLCVCMYPSLCLCVCGVCLSRSAPPVFHIFSNVLT